jgi:mannosyltransferase OCH1-like enzyme
MIQLTNKKLLNKKQKEILNKVKQRQKELIDKHNANVRKMNEYNNLNINFPIKETYNSVIPLKLYTCWHTKELPPLMHNNYENLKTSNPEFEHHLFDENDCREFIKEHFNESVLNAYNSLIPCSYKSDLWRFCVLYINGGIYLDIKYKCVNNFKLIALTEKEHFVRDRPVNMTYTALIVVNPQNPIMLDCIEHIVQNVRTKYYGKTSLCPTGPGLLGRFFSPHEFTSMEIYFTDTTTDNFSKDYMVYKKTIILTYYDEYRNEQKKNQKNKYYSELWNEHNIYNCNSYKIVVARYNENIEWLNSEMSNCIIYNKGDKLDINNEIILDNIGRESETYLHYIVTNYHNLPDITVFTQARISDHIGVNDVRYLINIKNQALRFSKSQNFLIHTDRGNDKNWDKDWNLRNDGYYLKDNYKNNKPIIFLEWFKTNINPKYPNPIKIYCNAIFAVRKENIIKKPIEYYKNLLLEVNHHINSTEGHFFERSWYYIFS